MTPEKELIEKIRLLKKIKPEKEWVLLTKEKILGKEISFFPILNLRFAKVLFILLILFLASFSFLNKNFSYFINKLKANTTLLSEEEKTKLELELANKILEELSKFAKSEEIKKLEPSIKETKETVAKATKNLIKSKKLNKEIAKKTLELEKRKQEVEKVLGAKISDEEIENSTKTFIKDWMDYLETRSLNEEQKQILEEAKKYFENENLTKVLELLLLINNGQ
jgi:hypothetical protein